MAKASSPTPKSYFQARLFELGITADINSFEVPNVISRYDEAKNLWTFEPVLNAEKEQTTSKYDIFETDDDDNIRINYYRLTGSHYYWKSGDSNTPKKYFRTRLKVPREIVNEEGKKDQMKYSQAKGSGLYPFFPPSIIQKYIKETEIETLFVVEGEIKAFKGAMVGIDIIGIPSIHGFYANDVPGKLHEDIQELIGRCKVKKIVYLTDADTLTVKWEEDKDLRKRINSFYAAVKNFRNSLQLLLDSTEIPLQLVYFMHLRTKFEDSSKGLDDLLCNLPAKTAEIKNDIHQFDLAKGYFSGQNITDNRYNNTIYNYFGLSDVEKFYNTYKKYIGNREFRWGKSRYQWDGEVVKYQRHEDTDKYFRVGADWLKVIKTPNATGAFEEEIISFKITEITRDYKKHPDFIENLQRFDGFCNVPNWNGQYKRKHGDCYNLCDPLLHDAKQGSINLTLKYLKHVFGGEATVTEQYNEETKSFEFTENAILGDQFTVILDYLTLQFQRPKQTLPVPILVSKEQETGKTTFLNWLRAIYGSNATILNNQQFQMNFNAHYITKFIIGLDEGFLDVEKKAEKEKLKQLATATEVFLERKGIDLKKVPYYGKLTICSNDADKVMGMDPEDRRWFVVKVPKLKPEEKDPFMEEKIKEEIPAWLHYLSNRKVFHKKETSLWFKTEYIITEQFMKIVEVTKSRIDKVVESFLKDMFLTYRMPVMRFDLKTMLEYLNDPKVAKYKIDEKDLVYYLEERKGLKRQKAQRIKIPKGFTENNIVVTVSIVARPYELRHEDWLDEAEMKEFEEAIDLVTISVPQAKKQGVAITSVKPAAADDQLKIEGTDDDEDLPF